MFGRFKRTKAVAVSFCERCSRICDAGCRRTALRERATLRQVWLGMRA